MVHILKSEYWSRADSFLLPLTGLSKSEKYDMSSYLFWNEYSIEDYRLMVTFHYNDGDYDEFLQYCRHKIFPILDKKGYLVENYDVRGKVVFILDISEWALDIQMFLEGKYSKMSREAKQTIQRFHTFDGNKLPIHVYSVLHPQEKIKALDGLTPLEYVSKEYGLDLAELEKIGEVGSIYDKVAETLFTTVDEIC